MTAEELTEQGIERVRNSDTLLAEFKKLYRAKFGYEPSCAACSLKSDWKKFTNSNYQAPKFTVMNTTKTFVLRDSHRIYTFEERRNNRAFKVRSYGYAMTEDYARKYLTTGTEEQLAARRAEFKVLPSGLEEKKDTASEKTLKELKEEAKKKGYDEKEWGKLKKEELIAYLESKEIETEGNENAEK